MKFRRNSFHFISILPNSDCFWQNSLYPNFIQILYQGLKRSWVIETAVIQNVIHWKIKKSRFYPIFFKNFIHFLSNLSKILEIHMKFWWNWIIFHKFSGKKPISFLETYFLGKISQKSPLCDLDDQPILKKKSPQKLKE